MKPDLPTLCILRVQEVGSLVGLVQLGLGQLSAALGLLHRVSELFDLAGEQVGSSLDDGHLLYGVLASSLGIVELDNGVLELALEDLDLLAGIGSLSVGVAKLNLQIVEVAFELLLRSDGFGARLRLRVHGRLHGLESSLTVSSRVVDFLLLLGQSSLKVLLVLGHLDRESKNLGLLDLNGAFSLLKGGLKLVSLLLQRSLGLLELVDGLAALTQLVATVRSRMTVSSAGFCEKVWVLSLNNIFEWIFSLNINFNIEKFKLQKFHEFQNFWNFGPTSNFYLYARREN